MSARAARAALVCALLAAVATAQAWLHPATHYAGYSGDPQQTMWYLRWTPYALAHGWNPLTTVQMGYPDGANLMWNTPVVLIALVLSPVTLLFGPVVAYNLGVALAFAATGLAAYAALRRFVASEVAALVGVGLYELSPYTASHALGQLNLTVAVAPPLVLLLLHEALVRRRWSAARTGALLGLVAAGQLMVSEEQLASTGVAALVLVVVLGVLVAVRERRSGVGALRAGGLRVAVVLGWALAVFAPLAAFPLAVQFGGPQVVHGPVQRPELFSNDLLSLLVPTQSQLVSPAAALDLSGQFSGNPVEWSGYLGLPLLALLAWVVWRRRDLLAVRAAALTGAVLWVLSLGPVLHVAGTQTGVPLPFGVIQRVPLLGNMLPGRLSLFVDLCAAVLVAVAAEAALGDVRTRVRSVGVVAVVLALTLPAVPLPTDTGPLPAFFTSAAAQRLPDQGSVLVVPFTTDFTSSQPLLWQAEAGMRYRMPGGYAMVPGPGGRAQLRASARTLGRAIGEWQRGIESWDDPLVVAGSRADLQHWDVRGIVVGPVANRAKVLAGLTAVVGCAPAQVEGVEVWWTVTSGGTCPG